MTLPGAVSRNFLFPLRRAIDLSFSLQDVFEIVLRLDQMPPDQKEEWLGRTAELLGLQPEKDRRSLLGVV